MGDSAASDVKTYDTRYHCYLAILIDMNIFHLMSSLYTTLFDPFCNYLIKGQ